MVCPTLCYFVTSLQAANLLSNPLHYYCLHFYCHTFVLSVPSGASATTSAAVTAMVPAAVSGSYSKGFRLSAIGPAASSHLLAPHLHQQQQPNTAGWCCPDEHSHTGKLSSHCFTNGQHVDLMGKSHIQKVEGRPVHVSDICWQTSPAYLICSQHHCTARCC